MKVLRPLLLALAASALAGAAAAPTPAPANRVASIFLSQDLLNRLVQKHLKSSLLREVTLELQPDTGWIAARGLLKIPTEEIKAVNLEKGLGEFRFQVTIQLKTTREGYLILVFPLEKTFFY